MDENGATIVDKKTGKQGLMLSASSIKWIADNEVEVKGGHYWAGRAAEGCTFTLKKRNGVWRVVKDKRDWIS